MTFHEQPDYFKIIGELLEGYRVLNCNMRAEELAEVSGIDVKEIENIESGAPDMDQDKLAYLLRYVIDCDYDRGPYGSFR